MNVAPLSGLGRTANDKLSYCARSAPPAECRPRALRALIKKFALTPRRITDTTSPDICVSCRIGQGSMDFYNVDLYDMHCCLEGCDGANASASTEARQGKARQGRLDVHKNYKTKTLVISWSYSLCIIPLTQDVDTQCMYVCKYARSKGEYPTPRLCWQR